MSHNQESNRSELSEIGSYHCPSNTAFEVSHRRHVAERAYVTPDVIMVMRHSERLDDCCQGWIEKCEQGGKYQTLDLNMPTKLPILRPLREFVRDTCLTRSGVVLSQMIGRGLQMTDNVPDIIYCSPSLRCIQTATWVREMSGSGAMLRVEPGVFENFVYPAGVPCFITPLQRQSFPVDKDYKPFYPLDKVVAKQETNSQYNERIRITLNKIAEQQDILTTDKPVAVLIVAHASTVDMAVGLLREKPRITNDVELDNIAIPVPYCAAAYLKKKNNYWTPQPHVLPPVTYEHLTTKYNPHFVHRP